MNPLVQLLFVVGVLLVVLIPLVSSSVKVVQEYERGVVFRLGRLVGPRGPGLFLILPFVDRMVKIDLRTVTMEVPAQEIITRDNVSIRVSAVLYFAVIDPAAAVTRVSDYVRATFQIAQTTLRSVVGQSELDELLANREKINQDLQRIIDEQTGPWGVKVSTVEVKDVELPQTMQRAMARQAEAEREKRAKIIHAEGELQASQQLAEAAAIIGSEPATLQLRYLQTLTEIASERNSTIIFPVPIDLLQGLMNLRPASENGATGAGHPPGYTAPVRGAPAERELERTARGAGEGGPARAVAGAPLQPSPPADG